MPDRAFFKAADILEQERDISPSRFFELMHGIFKISGLLYMRADILDATFRLRRLHHTLDARTADWFTGTGAATSNPFVSAIVNGAIRPLDWHAVSGAPFAGNHVAKCEKQGVTLPLAGIGRTFALLAIQSDDDMEDWQRYRRAHLRDFQYLANLFHANVVERDNRPHPQSPEARLTGRETEVLGWAAAGKSYWEIAVILGITERTVRFFMTNARRKLNVVSNAQAVATAMRHDLLRSG